MYEVEGKLPKSSMDRMSSGKGRCSRLRSFTGLTNEVLLRLYSSFKLQKFVLR